MEELYFENSKECNNLIKKIIDDRDIKQGKFFINTYLDSDKKYIQKGILKLEKFILLEQEEDLRLEKMYSMEKELFEKGYDCVIGIDEVGRGPFAGPVTVCGVVLPLEKKIRYVNDSKKLSKEVREKLDDEIRENSIDFVLYSMTNADIDEFGIKNCTLSCMEKCVMHIVQKGYKNPFVLIDAERLKDIDIPQRSIIKGDTVSASIAAASILAKNQRDRLMEKFHDLYSEYDFKSNVGYNSPKHFEGLLKYGICPIHRKGFVSSALYNKGIGKDEIGNKYNIEF
ncbi:MAG: ribonuclease HII [Lachnospirales bacterium]